MYIVTMIIVILVIIVDLKIEIAFQLIELYRRWSGTQLSVGYADVLDIALCNTRFYNIFVVNIISHIVGYFWLSIIKTMIGIIHWN